MTCFNPTKLNVITLDEQSTKDISMAVILQAIKDFYKNEYKKEVISWFKSPNFTVWADAAGFEDIDGNTIVRRLSKRKELYETAPNIQ